MRILVTGGAGFIGSTIVDMYVNAGHSVWVIDNESSGKRSQVNPRARYKRMDVLNQPALKKLFKSGRFDVVNHHAAQIDVRKSVMDPAFDARINILGLLNVLERVRENRVKKVIFSSSGGTAYGECTRPARVGFPENPLSPYGVTKLSGEKYIKAYSALHGIRHTIFRYANVYGPRQDPHGEAGVVAIFSQKLLKAQAPFVFGGGGQTRDFVYVKDVARANLMALTGGHNQILNIGTSRETSVSQLYDLMAEIAGSTLKAIKKPARKGELNRSVLDIAGTRKILGWSPKTSLRQGLSETIDYFANGRA